MLQQTQAHMCGNGGNIELLACMPRRPKVSRIYHFVIILFKFQLLRAVKVLVPFQVPFSRSLTSGSHRAGSTASTHPSTQAFYALFCAF